MAKASRILAVDFGYKRMGLAISDPTQTIASPLETVEGSSNPQKAAELIAAAYRALLEKQRYEISEIVVGLPLNMNGSDSERTTAVRAFVLALQEKLPIPIQVFDERLTSMQAERLLQEGGLRRKERGKVVDKVAAVIILQTYLSFKAR